MISLSIFPLQCSYPVFPREDAHKLQVYHFFIPFSSPVDPIQALLIISFSLFQIPSQAGAPHNHSLLAILFFGSAEDISEDLCLHYQSVQDISRLLSHSSHLIQPVQSLFSSNHSTMFLLSGP